MSRALISEDKWQNALGCLAEVALLPVAILLRLVTMPFEWPAKRRAEEVARYLRDFIEGTGGDRDFDDFLCIPIADPASTPSAPLHRACRCRDGGGAGDAECASRGG